MHTQSCPICGSDSFTVFHQMAQIPVHVGVLWPSEQQARNCPKGDVALAHCKHCGFISNVAFDAKLVDYHLKYDNALHFSPFFQNYERALASRLIERYDIRNRKVLEIGCGGGHFLGLLCELGNNRGLGFDPSHDPQQVDPRAKGKVEFFREYYSEEHTGHEADLICCRHVLEHIAQPAEFVRMIRRSLADRPETVLYFEVPNARLILEKLSIWDIMYEHCDYFTLESLGYLFDSCGFEIHDLSETYEGQFVSIEVSPARSASQLASAGGDLQDLSARVEVFPQRFTARQGEWQSRLRDLEAAGSCAVVWGAGGKTVGFLNMLQIGNQIRYVVDVNPGKQGTYMAGGGQPIVSPEALKEIRPDTVIIVNPVYEREIVNSLSQMGLSPEVFTV
jgi:SAM-dependent methyltransferase